MKRNDYFLLAGFGLVVFGIALVAGRPLTMHEAVLPECTREMQQSGNWLVPTSGGRPWLHRPPLPHWTLLILNLPLGEISTTWQVRLGPLLAALAVVLTTAWLAQRFFGRGIGLLAGLILATSFQFARYAWLAEEDMFLCAVITGAIALFAWVEIAPGFDLSQQEKNGSDPQLVPKPFTRRAGMLGFFLLLGLSNLAKGLIFGPLMILAPVTFFLLSCWLYPPRETQNAPGWVRILRWCWLRGILLAAAVGGAWPLWAYQNYPDVLEMWRYDYGGRLNGGYIGEPWWYYLVVLLWAMLPWTPWVIVGLWLTKSEALRSAPLRLVWCWAVGILVFFSIPDGKHHHYFLHSLPGWAILAALGLVRGWEWLAARPWAWARWLRQFPTQAAACTFGAWGLVFIAMHLAMAHWLDQSREDAAFLKKVPTWVEQDAPLLVNAELRSCLEVNRILFDLGPRVRAIHNLSFLLAEENRMPRCYLLTQAQDARALAALGSVRTVGQSRYSRREAHPGERLTLFAIDFAPNLPRYSGKVYIQQQQIKQRIPGPYLGGVAPKDWPSPLSAKHPQHDPMLQSVGHQETQGK